MTDEELSELAECIADACRNIPVGYEVRPARRIDSVPFLRNAPVLGCCPLGALLGPKGQKADIMFRYPNGYALHKLLDLDMDVASGFFLGYDGSEIGERGGVPEMDARAFELGKLFREEYP